MTRTNLPTSATTFVAPAGEIERVMERLRDSHLLTLTGSGGCGKTRLALEMARQLEGDFVDGAWLVELEKLSDPESVVQAVAAALNVRDVQGQALLATLCTALQEKHLLLIPDNCENVVDACARVANALLQNCGGLHILATSREALAIAGEITWRVPSLRLPPLDHLPATETLVTYEAIRLFVERAAAAQPGFAISDQNASIVASVCHRLDGIPLAIELAAARVRGLSVRQLAARLDQRFELLTGGSRAALPRQQTLVATVEWSYDLLDSGERPLFNRLGVFAGSFSLDAAEAVCGAPDAGCRLSEDGEIDGRHLSAKTSLDVLSRLLRLVDKSLVLAEEGTDGVVRYRLLETLRQFARDRLSSQDDALDIHRRHATHYVTLVDEAEPNLVGANQGEWLDRLEAEHDDLRAALRWVLDNRVAEPDQTLHLAGALWRFWFVRGYLGGGLRWLEEAIAVATSDLSPPKGRNIAPIPRLPKVLNSAGVLAHYRGDYGKAARLCGEGLALSRQLDHQLGIADALNGLALVARSGGNFPAARTMYEASLAILRLVGSAARLAYTLAYSGYTIWCLGEGTTARGRYEESLAIYRTLGDRSGIATALVMQGLWAHYVGDYRTARIHFEQALSLFRDVGDRRSIARTVRNLADVALAQANYANALELYDESLVGFRELGDKYFIAACLMGFGYVNGRQGHLDRAATLLGAAAGLRSAIGGQLSRWDFGDFERERSLIQVGLGEAAFAAAFGRGEALALEDVFALARQSLELPGARPLAVTPASSSVTPHTGRPSSSNGPFGLTPRELDVLRLVATGLTDAQVADQLVLSPRTINSHLHSIYGKLGVSSRSAATRHALERKLV
jgi:non-specific serine/threonine protein kinase